MADIKAPCLDAFDPKMTYPYVVNREYGFVDQVDNSNAMAQRLCENKMRLKDVLKKHEVRTILGEFKKFAPELALALERAEKQFDFVRAILEHLNQENIPEEQITVRAGLEYAVKNHPLEKVDGLGNACKACRATITDLLKRSVAEIHLEQDVVQDSAQNECGLDENDQNYPRL